MRGRSRMVVAGVAIAALVGGSAVWYVNSRPRSRAGADAAAAISIDHANPPPAAALDRIPAVDFTNVDQAVVKAIVSAQQVVRKEPDSAEAWGKLGNVLAAHEFNEAAREAYARARRLDAKDARWPYLQARAFSLGDAEATLEPLEAAVAICGDQPDAPLLTLCEALIAVDRIDEAERQLTVFLKRHTANARANLAMGRCQLAKGDLVRAAEYTRMAEDHPATRKSANELLTQILLRQGKKDELEQRKHLAATAADARWPDPYHDQVVACRVGLKVLLVRADKLFSAGEVEQSIALLQQAAQAYPNSDWAHVLLGRSLIRARRLTEAEQVLNQALRISPHSVEAQFRLGVAIYLQKRPSEAAEWFRKAIAVKPDFTMAHYNLGYCLMELEDAPGAIQAFESAAASDPNHFDSQTSLAALLTREGRLDEARLHWQRALEIRPADPNVRQQLRRSGQ